MHKILLVLTFLLGYSISSFELYTYYDIGTLGFIYNDDVTGDSSMMWKLNLPGFHFREIESDLGFSIKVGNLTFSDIHDENSQKELVCLDTKIYWSLLPDEKFIFGPFADIGINMSRDKRLDSSLGIKYSFLSAEKKQKGKPEYIHKLIDAELGYSFREDNFYLTVSTDLFAASVVFAAYYLATFGG